MPPKCGSRLRALAAAPPGMTEFAAALAAGDAAHAILDDYATDRPLVEVAGTAIEHLRAGAAAGEWVDMLVKHTGHGIQAALGLPESLS